MWLCYVYIACIWLSCILRSIELFVSLYLTSDMSMWHLCFKRWNGTVWWFDWDIFTSSCDCLIVWPSICISVLISFIGIALTW